MAFWKKKPPFDAREYADTAILEALKTFNLPARRGAQGLICGVGELAVRCADVQVSEAGRVASLIVDLSLGSPGPLLRENVAGMGETVDESITEGAWMWLMSVFVAACALFDEEGHPGHLDSVEDRKISPLNGTPSQWKIVSSPAYASVPGVEEGSEIPPATWPFLEPLARELAAERRLHTVKVLVMQAQQGRIVECSVNGVPAPHIAPLLDDFHWLPDEGTGWIRQFHLMQPVD